MLQPYPPPAEIKVESSTVLLQAWCWARPHLLLLWRTPLWWGMWPLWLWLPWFSAAQPQAALHSTHRRARPVHRDHSMTTVSQWQGHLTTRQYFSLFRMIDQGAISIRLSAHPRSWDTFHVMLIESETTLNIITAGISCRKWQSSKKWRSIRPPGTLMCSCCPNPGLCLFPGACLPCSKGFYQPLTGQQQCWPCNRGFYTK